MPSRDGACLLAVCRVISRHFYMGQDAESPLTVTLSQRSCPCADGDRPC